MKTLKLQYKYGYFTKFKLFLRISIGKRGILYCLLSCSPALTWDKLFLSDLFSEGLAVYLWRVFLFAVSRFLFYFFMTSIQFLQSSSHPASFPWYYTCHCVPCSHINLQFFPIFQNYLFPDVWRQEPRLFSDATRTLCVGAFCFVHSSQIIIGAFNHFTFFQIGKLNFIWAKHRWSSLLRCLSVPIHIFVPYMVSTTLTATLIILSIPICRAFGVILWRRFSYENVSFVFSK